MANSSKWQHETLSQTFSSSRSFGQHFHRHIANIDGDYAGPDGNPGQGVAPVTLSSPASSSYRICGGGILGISNYRKFARLRSLSCRLTDSG